jgi:glycosyltransferase involved in cell wall biosynthesis
MGSKAQTLCLPLLMELPERVVRQERTPFLLYLGRIHPIKGIENLLDALAQCKAFQMGTYTLKIAGKGESDYVQQLQKRIQDQGISNKIEFLGHVEGAAKQQLLADATYLVLPSFSENFGAVVVEALAQGTPVIAAKGTPWEMLETQKAGFWTSNEVTLLADTVEKALTISPPTYKTYRQHAQHLVQERFDVYQNIQQYITAFEAIARA